MSDLDVAVPLIESAEGVAKPEEVTQDRELGVGDLPVEEARGGAREMLALLVGEEPVGDADMTLIARTLVARVGSRSMPKLLLEIVRESKADDARALIDVLELLLTESRMHSPDSREKLEEAGGLYGLSQWLERRQRQGVTLTREDLIQWWNFFVEMSAVRDVAPDRIDKVSQTTNLWKATKALAQKMGDHPPDYGYLPPYLINHPEQVDRVLLILQNPRAFLEVLTGETWEDLQMSESFLKAFIGVEMRDGQSVEEAVLETVMLALQNQ